MEKTRTTVTIAGKDYTIAGTESAEYINRVAFCVNEKMRALRSDNAELSHSMLSVLTAINLADDYLKMKDELEQVKEELEKCKKRIAMAVNHSGKR